jgi:hypothetical protein
MDLNNLGRILTTRGYAIRKNILTPEQEKHIRTELTVSPKIQARVQTIGKSFTVFYESPKRYYLPRHWARENLGLEELNVLPDGDPLPDILKFQGKPFDYQEEIIQKFNSKLIKLKTRNALRMNKVLQKKIEFNSRM